MSRDVILPKSSRRWAWGRNKGFVPAVVQVANMPATAPSREPEVWVSVFSQRGWDRGTSPIDIHLTAADAHAVAETILAAVNVGED